MIKIKVSNLSNGRYDYDFEGKASDLDISDPYVGNFKTVVALTKYESQIILDSETGITANLICDRCAKEFQSVIKSSYKLVYLFRISSEIEETENEDVVYIHPDTDKIELDKDIRDYAILAVPMKKLCSENCKGLCPKCGKNLNDGPCDCVEEIIDPRWEPLQKLKSKK
ncbi:MAG: DUF177 domain-containing protein [Ignavibacteriaceae bacterium]|nr:DUF177 domain-containing protein [Ignavibacteriaceae bacterium]